MIRKFFIVLFMTHVSSCNNSTCGPECEEIEESPVVSGAQTYSPVATTTTQALTIPYCTTEGQSNCIVDGVNFKAVKPSNIDPWDIRVGKTVGGVQGKLKVNCRNRILSTAYNYDGDISLIGNGSQTGGITLDVWDTIDDYNNNLSGLPPDIAMEWGYETDCGGLETSSGDSNVWTDVTTTTSGESSNCTVESARCTLQDKISGLWVSKIQTPTTGLIWGEAWRRCLELNHNAKDDWRLPTQKELLAIYVHGARSVASSNWISTTKMADNFWSGTTVSSVPANAYDASLARSSVRNIYSYGAPKTNSFNVICVR